MNKGRSKHDSKKLTLYELKKLLLPFIWIIDFVRKFNLNKHEAPNENLFNEYNSIVFLI